MSIKFVVLCVRDGCRNLRFYVEAFMWVHACSCVCVCVLFRFWFWIDLIFFSGSLERGVCIAKNIYYYIKTSQHLHVKITRQSTLHVCAAVVIDAEVTHGGKKTRMLGGEESSYSGYTRLRAHSIGKV